MKRLIQSISRFFLKVLITEISIIGVALIISYFSKMNMNDLLVYIGLFCILIGGLSLLGSNNNSADVCQEAQGRTP